MKKLINNVYTRLFGGRKVSARRTRLGFEVLEDRATPATLNISGGALTYTAGNVTNTLTVSLTNNTATGIYSFAATGETITLGAGAIAAGWTGSGTATVKGYNSSVTTSITINGGSATDTVNIRSANDALTINADNVNLSSNAPTNTGSLDLITPTVGVTATNLTVADFAPTANNSAVIIGASSITGLAPSTITYTVSNLLRVIGSNNAGHAEQYTVTSPGADLRLDTNAGNDSVIVTATVAVDPVTVNTGVGNDTIVVSSTGDGDDTSGNLDGILGTLTIDAGSGANVLQLNDYTAATANSTITAGPASITGLAGPGATPTTVNYKAVGGSFSNLELRGANGFVDTFAFLDISSAYQLNVYGNGGAEVFNITGDVRANIFGGADGDSFNFNTNGRTLTGSIDGEAGSDTLSYVGRTLAVASTLTSVDNTGLGYGGTSTGITAGFAGIDVVTGTGTASLSGEDTLTGRNVAATVALGASQTYTSDDSGANARILTFSGFDAVTGGSAVDTFNVTALSTPITLNGAGDADSFSVTGNSNDLDAIAANITVNGDGDTDALTVNDSADTAGQTYGFGSTEITRNLLTVTYGTLETLAFTGADSTSNAVTYDIESFATGLTSVMITADATSPDNTLNVGANSAVFSLGSNATVNGTFGTVTVTDSGRTSAATWTISSTSVSNGTSTLTLGTAPSAIVVFGANDQNDTFGSVTTTAGTAFTLDAGTTGTDTVTIVVSGDNDADVQLDGFGAADTVAVNGAAIAGGTWNLANNGVTITGGTFDIKYSISTSPANVTLTGSTGNDTFNVAASTLINYTLDGVSGAADTINVSAGSGATITGGNTIDFTTNALLLDILFSNIDSIFVDGNQLLP